MLSMVWTQDKLKWYEYSYTTNELHSVCICVYDIIFQWAQ